MRKAIVIGSVTDQSIVERAFPYLDFFGLEYELSILSAHRNAKKLDEFVEGLTSKNYIAIIAAAGMANHLAGALAARTNLPVIGLPLPGGIMDGLDALLSTVQMPGGVPVATVTVGKAGAVNAAVFAARIAALNNQKIAEKLDEFARNGYRLL